MTTDSSSALSYTEGLKALLDDVGASLPGFTVKIGGFSDMPSDQTILRSVGGRGEMAVAVDYPVVQVLTRSLDYQGAYRQAVACRDALVGIASGPTSYPELTSVVLQTQVMELGRDEKNRIVFSFNLQLIVSYDQSGHRDWA